LILLLLSPAAWMVISLLTATPAPNPIYESELRDLAAAQQRDPSAPNRHSELVTTLEEFRIKRESIEEQILDDRRLQDPDNPDLPRYIDIESVLYEPDQPRNSHLIQVEYAELAINEIESQ